MKLEPIWKIPWNSLTNALSSGLNCGSVVRTNEYLRIDNDKNKSINILAATENSFEDRRPGNVLCPLGCVPFQLGNLNSYTEINPDARNKTE